MAKLFNIDNEFSKKKDLIKAPFGWVGGKSRSVDKILPWLPQSKVYVEPFGGSGIVLLRKEPTDLEVFNDAYSGITDFYRCLADDNLWEDLVKRLDDTIHSREYWYICYETWKNVDDPIERAARWYYMLCYSFSQKGEFFGRSVQPKVKFSGRVRSALEIFPRVHNRLRNVQIENLDFREIIRTYDSVDTVFYVDPPYLETSAGTYKHSMTHDDHHDLINMLFRCQGYVVMSGFSNAFYNDRDWDNTAEWENYNSIGLEALKNQGLHIDRTKSVEKLFIKSWGPR